MAGFKINYKCSGMLKDWPYICEDCKDTSILTHKTSDDMSCHECKKCGGHLLRHITVAPSLDADYHDSCRTHNIGWSLEGQDPDER